MLSREWNLTVSDLTDLHQQSKALHEALKQHLPDSVGVTMEDSGCSVESIRVVWSVPPAWEAVELTLGDCLHLHVRGPRLYRFGSDHCGCSMTNAWRFFTFPDADCLPVSFLVKLVP
jgi:hypothetical protein